MTTPIVSTRWLAEHLHDDNLRIVDIRGHVLPASEPPPYYFNHHDDYLQSHIPNAVFIDWVKEITDPNDPRHAQIAQPERYAAVMSKAGIDENTFVVAYDDAQGMFASRLWWSLNYYGHGNVAILGGGWQKWLAENLPTSNDIPEITPTQFVSTPNRRLRRTGDEVLSALGSKTAIVDVRSVKEFDGQASRAQRFGHIPGAINIPRKSLLDENGSILPPDQLRSIFEANGITIDTPEITLYCNGGVSAAFGLLAMQLAGFDNATMYDASWKDWGNDPTKPIE